MYGCLQRVYLFVQSMTLEYSAWPPSLPKTPCSILGVLLFLLLLLLPLLLPRHVVGCTHVCRKLYYFVQGKPFEYFIMAVIILNSAMMATSFYGQPEEMTSIAECINYAFTGVYVIEFVLKVGCMKLDMGAGGGATNVQAGAAIIFSPWDQQHTTPGCAQQCYCYSVGPCLGMTLVMRALSP